MSDNAAGYSGYREWKSWDRPFRYDARDAEIFAGELSGIPLPGARLLEIGFGEGRVLAWARDQGARVAGTEIQPALVAAAREAGVPVVDADLAELAAASADAYDVIVALDVLEHLPFTDLAPTLASVRRLLAPGGRFVARFPNGQSPFGRVFQYGDPTHAAVLSVPILRHVASGAGLTVERAGNAYRPLGIGAVKRLANRMRHRVRDGFECIIGLTYGIGRVPFDPNVTMVLRRPSDTPSG